MTQPTGTVNLTGLTGAQQNANTLIKSVLASWGLDSLSSTALDYIKQGYSSDAIQFLLEQTPQYAQRFPANALRMKQGLPPLSPAEYIATENSYRQVMAAAGLPKNFYDTNQDFSTFIANDVSPSELQSRVTMASTLVNQSDPGVRQALQQYYGVTPGMIVAHYLDQNVAAPILQQQEAAAQIGGAALAQGLASTSKQQAETFAQQGVTYQQAQAGEQKVAQVLPVEQQIAARYGQTYDQATAENEFVGGLASAARARQNLNLQEKASFAGDTGLQTTLYGSQGRAAGESATPPGAF